MNNGLAEIFMGEIVVVEKVIIEEMAERSVADIVQQSGDPHVLFDIGRRRALIAEDLMQRRIKMFGKLSGQSASRRANAENGCVPRTDTPNARSAADKYSAAAAPTVNRSTLFRSPRPLLVGTVNEIYR